MPYKINLKKYLLYSSVFSIFTEAFYFRFIIDWKLFYLIILFNFIIIMTIKKIKYDMNFLLVLLFIFVHALLINSLLMIPYHLMISQILGIAIVSLYFYNLIPLYTIDEVIKVYCKLCIYIALIGIVLYLVNYNDSKYRLMSVFKEPAHFAIVIIPSCYYYLKRKKVGRFLLLFIALLLSNSSLGYIGCGLIFLISNLNSKRFKYFLISFPIVTVVFIILYYQLPFFNMRVKETYNSLNVVNTGKFKDGTNLSSYAFVSNLFVTKSNMMDHPLGTGIGSHEYSYMKNYHQNIRPPKYLKTLKLDTSNASDANSLFLRICSEFGLIGLFGIIYILIIASKCFSSEELFFAQGIYIYFLLKLFRDGHYFPPEFFFFICIFYFMFQRFRKQYVRNTIESQL